MRGKQVVVRDFKGKPVVCYVWDEDLSAVYVVNEEGLRLLQSQGRDANLIPAGFLKEDVFTYEPWIDKEAGKADFDWARLQPWRISN